MPKIQPVSYKKLAKVFEKAGFEFIRQSGDHLIYSKEGVSRPVVIPMYEEVPVFIIRNNLRSAGMSREQYFKLLETV